NHDPLRTARDGADEISLGRMPSREDAARVELRERRADLSREPLGGAGLAQRVGRPLRAARERIQDVQARAAEIQPARERIAAVLGREADVPVEHDRAAGDAHQRVHAETEKPLRYALAEIAERREARLQRAGGPARPTALLVGR